MGGHQQAPLEIVESLVDPGAISDLESECRQRPAEAVRVLRLMGDEAEKCGVNQLRARRR